MMSINRKIILFCAWTMMFPILAFSQQVLIEDVYVCFVPGNCDHFIDTLESHGVVVHRASIEGRGDLMNMNALFLINLHWLANMDSLYPQLIDFVRNGGNILMWTARDPGTYTPYNPILSDTRWEPTMQILCEMTGDTPLLKFINFPPFTNGLDSLALYGSYLTCGNHAFPFGFCDSLDGLPAVSISYPFVNENNCNSFVVLTSGWVAFERSNIYPYPDKQRFGSNLFLGTASVPGYELEPGAIPGGGNACAEEPEQYNCFSAPNPFTPNGDGFNDYCQFEFDNIGQHEGTIFIYNIHGHEVKQINVPAGANAKTAAQWHGADNNGNPLPQGLYIYVIESGGEIVCEGTVTLAR